MAQKTEVEIGVKDKATAELKGISGAFEKMRISVETNNKGINKLDGALRGMGAQAASLPGPLGRVADALADFAPGGLVGAAYLAGFGAMIMITKSYFDAAERTKKINEELAQTIADIEGRGKQFQLSQLQEELRKLGEESESGWKKFWLGSDGRLFGFGLSWDDQRNQLETEIRKTSDTIAKELDAAQQRVRTTAGEISLARAEAGGTGPQERLKQAETALVVAQNALAVAIREGKTQADIANLQANVNSAEANHIRAMTALRDDQANKREKALERERKLQETITREREERERFTQKVIEDGLRRIERQAQEAIERRKTIAESIAKDIQVVLDASILEVNKTIDTLGKSFENARKKAEEQMQYIEPLIYSIGAGFDVMVDAIFAGKNAFDAFGRGVRAIIVQELKNLAQTFIVKGTGQIAEGLANLANPLTAPSAALNFKSAAKYFAGAALAGVGSRAAAGNAAGGTGAGQAFNNSQLGRNNFNTQQPLTIVIQGGLLDMSNPDTQRSFVGALETVTNRRVNFRRVGA